MGEERPVLVTGFGPFRGHPINASWEAVQELKKNLDVQHGGRTIPLEVRHIVVAYDTVKAEVPRLWRELKPRLCVHVGVAGTSRVIRLEKFGRNVGYDCADVQGKLPGGNVCVSNGPDKLSTQFDLEEVCRRVGEELQDVRFAVTDDAGRYLCDFIYYTSLYLNQGPVLFVHVPDLGTPYSCEQLAKSLKHIIECLLDQLE